MYVSLFHNRRLANRQQAARDESVMSVRNSGNYLDNGNAERHAMRDQNKTKNQRAAGKTPACDHGYDLVQNVANGEKTM